MLGGLGISEILSLVNARHYNIKSENSWSRILTTHSNLAGMSNLI